MIPNSFTVIPGRLLKKVRPEHDLNTSLFFPCIYSGRINYWSFNFLTCNLFFPCIYSLWGANFCSYWRCCKTPRAQKMTTQTIMCTLKELAQQAHHTGFHLCPPARQKGDQTQCLFTDAAMLNACSLTFHSSTQAKQRAS